jgi:dTMP kinase
MTHNYSGLFISLEGGEGGGKGTQINFLKNDLDKIGLIYTIAREPGGLELSEKIRNLLLDKQYSKNIITELFLYSAARSEFTEHKVIPVLSQGEIFIADRFMDSTTAYQGYAGGIDLEFVHKIHEYSTQNISPDITFFLDVPPVIGLERAKKSKSEYAAGDWQESKPIEYHERVRQGYLKIAELEPIRMKIIDVTQKPEVCYEEIKKHLNPLLLEKYGKKI